jgi:CheY-like chemotaxis protein
MPAGGALRIALRNVRLDSDAAAAIEGLAPGDYVRVTVTDTGRGMSRAALAHAFEPFFTTKDIGSGSGLGLAQVHGFARQSGGAATIRSKPGSGTRVALYFPRLAEAEAAPDQPAVATCTQDTGCTGTAATVLVVEDEPDTLDALQVMLTAAGHRVVPARDGTEALHVLRSTLTLDVLVSKATMPDALSGADLAGQARAIRPDLLVLLTADAAEGRARHHRGAAEDDVLVRPWSRGELLRRIAATSFPHRLGE